MLQQLMYRLAMAERIHLGQGAPAAPRGAEDAALADAERAEVLHQPPLGFSATVLLLGLRGGGKSSTVSGLLRRQLPAGYRATERCGEKRGGEGGARAGGRAGGRPGTGARTAAACVSLGAAFCIVLHFFVFLESAAPIFSAAWR